jgi:2',3'-cyclic-nucleotide 2'-phosphodiesterase (5'-nucleotidase family)
MKNKFYRIWIIVVLNIVCGRELPADSFYIIYTSNVNGYLENCGCGIDPLGGIGRVKTFVDSFRNEHEDAILIDGGDFLNSYPFPQLNEAMLEVLQLLDYNVIVPGDQEFVEGGAFYNKIKSKMKDRILISNKNDEKSQSNLTVGENQFVTIYSYLSPKVFDFIELPEKMTLNSFSGIKPEKITNTIRQENGSPADAKMAARGRRFNILILHGYLSEAYRLANKYDIDLILLAHDQNRGIWESNGTIITGNGKDSEYLSVIEVDYENDWELYINHIKISEAFSEDEQVLEIIEKFKNSLELN